MTNGWIHMPSSGSIGGGAGGEGGGGGENTSNVRLSTTVGLLSSTSGQGVTTKKYQVSATTGVVSWNGPNWVPQPSSSKPWQTAPLPSSLAPLYTARYESPVEEGEQALAVRGPLALARHLHQAGGEGSATAVGRAREVRREGSCRGSPQGCPERSGARPACSRGAGRALT